jgi:hypothetical protein
MGCVYYIRKIGPHFIFWNKKKKNIMVDKISLKFQEGLVFMADFVFEWENRVREGFEDLGKIIWSMVLKGN